MQGGVGAKRCITQAVAHSDFYSSYTSNLRKVRVQATVPDGMRVCAPWTAAHQALP